MKKVFNVRKAGHCGTLDPLATGLILIGCKNATKYLTAMQAAGKSYEFVTRFGEITESLDGATAVTAVDVKQREKIQELLTTEESLNELKKLVQERFVGEVVQQIPLYSAIKIDGRRLYKLAHLKDGKKKELQLSQIQLPSRSITIKSFDILDRRPGDDPRDVRMLVHCSSGTYVRVLANDVAKALGFIGGHALDIRRMSVADVSIDSAWRLEELTAMAQLVKKERKEEVKKSKYQLQD